MADTNEDQIPQYNKRLSKDLIPNRSSHLLKRLFAQLARFTLLPLQFALVLVLISSILTMLGALLPTIFPWLLVGAQKELSFLSRSSQIFLLAPIAALVLRQPLSLFALPIIAFALIRWDSWGARERKKGVQVHRDAPILRLLGDHTYEEDQNNEVIDKLGYSNFVHVLTKLILNSAISAPFAISIEARWGMGKTKVMNMMRELLNGQTFPETSHDWRCYTVYFNAWKYGGANDDVRKGLLSAVFAAIPPRALRWVFGRGSRKHLIQLGIELAARVLGASEASTQFAERIDLVARYRNEFEESLKRIMDHWQDIARKRPFLVIFVEDLDRCDPHQAALTLETIKLFFDAPQCVFVMGYDPELVSRIIQKRYADILDDGTAYLK